MSDSSSSAFNVKNKGLKGSRHPLGLELIREFEASRSLTKMYVQEIEEMGNEWV